MELFSEVVKHKVFGRGQIVQFVNNYVTVLFDESKAEKKFTYPSAFGAFLELENKSFQKQIEEVNNAIAQKEAENKIINEERAKLLITIKSKGNGPKRSKITTVKTSDKNNIALKCNYCDGGESKEIEIWIADAGNPISLKNAKANSLALFTTKFPKADDKDRFIFAVFLIDENHEGANPKYRIQLSLDEAKELKFWDYYFNPKNPEKIAFGSGLHKYLTDVQSTQVLKKICEIKKDTSEEEFSKEFLEYYCRLKKLDIDNITMPNGALQRFIGATSQ